MSRGGTSRIIGYAAEGTILALAVFAPWAFGSVEAWAELVLLAGVAVLTLLSLAKALAGPPGQPLARRPRSGPSVALGGLVLLALVQATPIPSVLFTRVDPVPCGLLLVDGG